MVERTGSQIDRDESRSLYRSVVGGMRESVCSGERKRVCEEYPAPYKRAALDSPLKRLMTEKELLKHSFKFGNYGAQCGGEHAIPPVVRSQLSAVLVATYDCTTGNIDLERSEDSVDFFPAH